MMKAHDEVLVTAQAGPMYRQPLTFRSNDFELNRVEIGLTHPQLPDFAVPEIDPYTAGLQPAIDAEPLRHCGLGAVIVVGHIRHLGHVAQALTAAVSWIACVLRY